MGYRSQVENAAKWLVSIQGASGGWGRTSGLAPSIVNTSEALCVLSRAGGDSFDASINNGHAYLKRVTERSLKKQARTRYAFFALRAIIEDSTLYSAQHVQLLVDWMFSAQNSDGGWGHEASDKASRLYPTVMAVLTLAELGHLDRVESACHWIASMKEPNGWALSPQHQPFYIATSMAVVALRKLRPAGDKLFENAKADLLTIDSWPNATEDLPGADWIHSGQMWGFLALTSLDIEPYVKPIADGVRDINKLIVNEGWREPGQNLTVRGQYWAVMALDALRQSFDPAVHVYRIDSARAQSLALEPKFAVIKPHSDWTVIVPARVYQWLTYGLLVGSAFVFLRINRRIGDPGRIGDFTVSVVLFLLALGLVKKRSKFFPRWFFLTVIMLGPILAVLSLIFGVTALSIWSKINR